MSNLFIKDDLIKRLMVQTQKSREQVIKMIEKARQDKFLKDKQSKMKKEHENNKYDLDPSISWADINHDHDDDSPFNPELIELTEHELSNISNSIESEYSSKKSHRQNPPRINTHFDKIVPPKFQHNDSDVPEPNLDFTQKNVNEELLTNKFYDILRENKYIFDNNYLNPDKKIMILQKK